MRKYMTQPRRRGATAIIAMLYLVLFSSMAIGFVAATTTAVQVAYNDDAAQRAVLAAESGMEFVRYHLFQLTIDRNTQNDELLDAVYAGLAQMMDGSPNLNGGSIALVNGTILIPAEPGLHVLINDSAGLGKFRATIALNEDDPGQTQLRVRVAGYHKSASAGARGVQLDYRIEQKPSEILKFGVAARGPIALKSNAHISGVAGEASFGSVLTTTTTNPAMTMAGSASVSGQVAITDPTNRLSYSSNASVGGYPASSPQGQANIQIGVDAPQFPFVDTSIFEPYATNVLTTPNARYGGYLSNLRIPANTNPTFDGSSVIEGIVYVEAPNKIQFESNMTIRGAIVVENNPPGDLTNNTIEFASNATINGVEALPDTPQWAEIKELGGAAIIAPNFAVSISSNFGSVGGMIVAGQITLDSNASGTVVGGFMSLSNDAPVTFSSNANILVQTRIANNTPAGLYFDKNYVPRPETYAEFVP